MGSYKNALSSVYNNLKDLESKGEKASYIPELKNIDDTLFGVSLYSLCNQEVHLGDATTCFSVQSITKVISLIMAYKLEGTKLWERVDVEPSGTPFNSLILLELEKGIPRNPFINAGAIVIADILLSHYSNPEQEFLNFVHQISGDTSITYDENVYQSEKSVAYRNYSLINLMKSFGNIHNDIERVMNFYFKFCSLSMNTNQLAKLFLFLANDGISPHTKEQILTPSQTKRINAIMQLCGFYDEAGEFAFRVGLPGKSGVGGGIIAIHPGKYSIAVYSPKLNKKGNSYKGMVFLEQLTSELSSSIF